MMKRRTKGILIAAILVFVSILVCSFAFGDHFSQQMEMGEQYGEVHEDSDSSQILVSYKGESITQSMIDDKKALGDSRSDGEIMTQILIGMLLLEEAEQKGLAATQAEIQSALQLLQENYEAYEETAQVVEEFCASVGITLEQYWAKAEEALYGTISRHNLKTHFTEEYCQSHNYAPDSLTDAQRAEIETAYEKHRAELLRIHQADIRYSATLPETETTASAPEDLTAIH